MYNTQLQEQGLNAHIMQALMNVSQAYGTTAKVRDHSARPSLRKRVVKVVPVNSTTIEIASTGIDTWQERGWSVE